jgi:hypothetical protein
VRLLDKELAKPNAESVTDAHVEFVPARRIASKRFQSFVVASSRRPSEQGQ